MLRGVGDEILNTTHNVVEENTTVNESAEARNLTSNGGSHLGLIVLEKLNEGGNEISRNNLLIHRLGNLQKVSIPWAETIKVLRTFSNRSAIM